MYVYGVYQTPFIEEKEIALIPEYITGSCFLATGGKEWMKNTIKQISCWEIERNLLKSRQT